MTEHFDELDFWLLAAIDAGCAFASHTAPMPLADAGLERRIARALDYWKARMGYDDGPWHVPHWLVQCIDAAPRLDPWDDEPIEG